ncbi:MAG: alpha-galactosidase [Clostridiales bacterium]|nr:alpha-galactosidase [Clostridiales bacterium]
MMNNKKLFSSGLPLSFLYGGKKISEIGYEIKRNSTASKDGTELTVIELIFNDGLRTRTEIRYFAGFGAYDWVTYFENTSDKNSETLSEINDCDIALELMPDNIRPGYDTPKETAAIYNPKGSDLSIGEFKDRKRFVRSGDIRRYRASGGRSSQSDTPFFEVRRGGEGYIFAIGWSGQWRCAIERGDGDIKIKTGIENAEFYLKPNEKFRTTSFLLMPFKDGSINAHNAWRRLLKNHFSLIGSPGRPKYAPLCHSFWGSRHSDEIISTVEKLAENELGFEYIWIDAGWYGDSKTDCPNEFEGDWSIYTGDWFVNKRYHPNGMRDVAEAVKKYGMKFLLWVEPERVVRTSNAVKEHPEYYLSLKSREENNLLLWLGNEEAFNYAYETLSNIIETFSLSCLRQDFNFDPLDWWRENDEEGRSGITEIGHVTGLYRLWDALLERFPGLIIDDCASGGRRIDIETIRRSVPLWRSDRQCQWDADPEITQTHSISFPRWVPYSGTGAGNVTMDSYRFRSCYGTSLTVNYWGYVGWEFDEKAVPWVKRMNEEYKRVRPYLSEDFYPLTLSPVDEFSWAASQYSRPREKDGMILIFRRAESMYDRAIFKLYGIENGKKYEFTDADTGEKTVVDGESINKSGYTAEMPQPRSSKLIFYREL